MESITTTQAQKFGSDIVWVAVYQVIASVLGIVTLAFLTKFYSAEIYGVWVQATVTVNLLVPIITLQLGAALVRFMAGEDDRSTRRMYLGAMLWPVVVVCCLVPALSLLFRNELSRLLFNTLDYIKFIPLIFSWAAIDALLSFLLFYLVARGKIKKQVVVQLILSAVKIALIIIFAISGYSLEWIIAGIIVFELLLTALVFSIVVRDTGFPNLSTTKSRLYLGFSAPLIPSALLLWIVNASDRYFIAHFIGLSQTGIYSASYALAGILSLFSGAIGFVLFPSISKLWSQNEKGRVKNYLEYSTKLFLLLALPGVAGLYILSQPLLSSIATNEYIAGSGIVLLLAVGALLFGVYQICIQVALLVWQTRWLLLIVGIAAAINVGINLTIIPIIGLIGAAIAAGVSFLFLAVIAVLWAWRVVGYKIDYKFVAKTIVASFIMAFCLNFIEISGVWAIALAIIAGAIVYAISLFLMKAFSREDLLLAREMLALLNVRSWVG